MLPGSYCDPPSSPAFGGVPVLSVSPAHDLFNVDVLVPDIESAHARHVLHQGMVLLYTADDRLLVLLSRIAVLPTCYYNAGSKALHISLPGSRKRLVEIVHVKDQIALRRGEKAKVTYMCIAADLHLDARDWRPGQVRRHDDR